MILSCWTMHLSFFNTEEDSHSRTTAEHSRLKHQCQPVVLLMCGATQRHRLWYLSPRSLQPLHTRGLQQPVFLRHLCNLLSLSYHFNVAPPVRNGQPRDPLDVCIFLVGFTFDSTISPQIPATPCPNRRPYSRSAHNSGTFTFGSLWTCKYLNTVTRSSNLHF